MFERYTTDARRSIFFARYEASNFGTREIDTEHLLLGILRADPNLAQSLAPFRLTRETIEKKIAAHRPPSREQVSTSVDLPVSAESKRAMTRGAEEADRMGQPNIGVESLLLGLAGEQSCFAAQILRDAGLTPDELRKITTQLLAQPRRAATPSAEVSRPVESSWAPPQNPPLADNLRDLGQMAADGELISLVGRETELRRAAQILSRRTRNNLAVIGESGVGKTALLEGLAGHICSGQLEEFAEHRIWQTEAAWLFPVKPATRSQKPADEILLDLATHGRSLLAIEGLFDLALARLDWGVTEAWHALGPHLAAGRLQIIATGTPAGLEATLAKAPDMARHFEVVLLAPPRPEEAVKILEGVKSTWEQFHQVTFAPGAIEMAVYASGRFLPHRSLPDRALDLLDEAAARVRLAHQAEPSEIAGLRKQIRSHARAMETAGARLDPTAEREHFEAEGAARGKLRALLEQRRQAGAAPPSVTPEDVEQVAADRVGAPVSAIRAILAKKGPADLDETVARLAEGISIELNPWLPLLAAYIARGSDAEIDALLDAIRAARLR
ncbi:MAG TPA: Clp protease N-terminal domain-containing protein [Bryobacteraceae bacterium]|nr:Clp protease N-terminal domain-containing protein [Bryobacteraceae bacterium]